MKVNNLIIMPIYAPVSQGSELLENYLRETSNLSVDDIPLIICGDLNAPYLYNGPYSYLRACHRNFASKNIFGVNAHTLKNDCLFDFFHTSDNHPNVSRVFSGFLVPDSSLRYHNRNLAVTS